MGRTSGIQDFALKSCKSKPFKQDFDEFMIEVKPPQGGVVPIMRTIPASLDIVMVLN